MANLVLASNSKSMPKLDGSIRNKVWAFIEKLGTDHTAPGLHIEPLKGAVDKRVRTGRVDLQYRAILFKIDDKLGDDPTFIYMGTWPHDDANKLAERSYLQVNPINGVLEAVVGELDGDDDRKKRVVVPDHDGGLDRAFTTSPTPAGYLAELGFTLEDFTDKLGIDPQIAADALAAADEDALMDVIAPAVTWQADALLELATGISIDDLRAKYALADAPADDGLDEDGKILKALDQPASKMQFRLIEDNEELRQAIENDDFAAWRVFLHPEQRKYAERKTYNGAFRLSGGAGTGKTVVAVHRARNLARENPDARIILTTYNKTLAQSLHADLLVLDSKVRIAARPGDPGVYVGGIDALGYAVLRQADNLAEAARSVLGYASIDSISSRTNASLWRELVTELSSGLDTKLATPAFLENEYIAVVLANRVTTLEQYVKVARAGRGVRLSRPQRIAVWKLVEAYRRQARMDGTLSYAEVLALAAESLRLRTEAGAGYLADHIVVDEAQDLHATHWALLRDLVAEGPNDLFIAEDSHQRIYGQPVVLGRLGIKIVGRSKRLTLNYRTTAENLHFAVSILSGAEYHDLEQGEESTAGYRSARRGPAPRLVECSSMADELDKVAAQVRGWVADGVDPSSVAVLTRSEAARDQFVRALGERGVPARALENKSISSEHVRVLTMHRSKGMEFSRVVLAGIDDAHVPSAATLKSVPDEERAEALLRERSLLYVAASRARDELVVTWSGARSGLLGSATTHSKA
ncbi:DNA helicase UvrD [Gordonia sihwensis]|uniref:3'-5' exonuclease n=1 Tax=Gordonia TaxID=2053 RepID=UPI001C92BB1B|nr:3'-5' exonuclease [Gordonia sihwensis]MBY4571127.1 DNA helicase UvrD [Gordonia sihwensis]WFN91663.1 3'-5' exonuclease [Gordonia sihwensis]